VILKEGDRGIIHPNMVIITIKENTNQVGFSALIVVDE
jgi:hypothetical protein